MEECSFSTKLQNNSSPLPPLPPKKKKKKKKKATKKSNDNIIRKETPNIRTLEIDIFSCSSRSFDI